MIKSDGWTFSVKVGNREIYTEKSMELAESAARMYSRRRSSVRVDVIGSHSGNSIHISQWEGGKRL